MILRSAALLALLSASLGAQAPPPDPGPKVRVRGRVLDSSGGGPVHGAQVSISQGTQALASGRSGPDGRFVLDDVPAGEGSIIALKSGYRRSRAVIRVPAVRELTGIDMEADREGVITGRVVDEREKPVIGAEVTALQKQYEGDRIFYSHAGRAGRGHVSTDDRGEFRLWGLDRGEYVVHVRVKPDPAPRGVIRWSKAARYFPSADTIDDALPIQVREATLREAANVRLKPAPPTVFEAVLTLSRTGTTCDFCAVRLIYEADDSRIDVGEAVADKAGRVRFEGLPAGAYHAEVIGAERSSREMEMWFAAEDIAISTTPTSPARIEVAPASPVRGKIIFEDPPADAAPSADNPWQVMLTLSPLEAYTTGMLLSGMRASVKAQGPEAEFELEGPPGDWLFGIRGSQQGYLARVDQFGRPSPDGSIHLLRGAAAAVTLYIRFDTGTVEGKVEGLPEAPTSGLLPARPAIVLRPKDSPAVTPYVALAQPDGSFSVSAPPGEYWAAALDSGSRSIFTQWGPRAPGWRSSLRSVQVRPNETVKLNLPLVSER